MDLQLPTAVSAAAALATLAQLAGTREMTRSMPKQACTGVWWKRIECVGGGSWCFQKQNQGRDKRRVMNLPAGRRSTPDAVSVHELCADAVRQGAPQQPKKRGGGSQAGPDRVRAGPASQRLALGGLEGGVRTGSLRPPPPWTLEQGKTASSLDTWPSPSATTGAISASQEWVSSTALQSWHVTRGRRQAVPAMLVDPEASGCA